MKPAMYRRNSWLPTNGWFPTVFDEFLNNDMLNTASNVAPSVNVRENEHGYEVELAAPGVKKEYCRVHVDEDHNLCVAIENKFEHKEEDKHSHYLRREFAGRQTFPLSETRVCLHELRTEVHAAGQCG